MNLNPDIPFELELTSTNRIVVPEFTINLEETNAKVSSIKKIINFKKSHPDKFIFTQSDMRMIIRKGEEIPHCPRQFMEVKVLKNFSWEPTLSMLYGSYFETLCLGRGAAGKMVLDLPRKVLSEKKKREMQIMGIPDEQIKGEKTVDQIRIEQQALRFPQRLTELKVTINEYNTQVPILKHLWDNVYVSGELDIWPSLMLTHEGLRWVILDLKLTSDVYNTWGEYCWGEPENMDHTQGHMYLELIKNIDFHLNPHLRELQDTMPTVFEMANNGEFSFYYWVWGYKKEPLHLQEKYNIRVHYGPTERSELWESFRKYVAIVEHYLALNAIPTQPCYDFCAKCPVSSLNGGYCTDMVLTKVV